jgi:hypothetical protein
LAAKRASDGFWTPGAYSHQFPAPLANLCRVVQEWVKRVSTRQRQRHPTPRRRRMRRTSRPSLSLSPRRSLHHRLRPTSSKLSLPARSTSHPQPPPHHLSPHLAQHPNVSSPPLHLPPLPARSSSSQLPQTKRPRQPLPTASNRYAPPRPRPTSHLSESTTPPPPPLLSRSFSPSRQLKKPLLRQPQQPTLLLLSLRQLQTGSSTRNGQALSTL